MENIVPSISTNPIFLGYPPKSNDMRLAKMSAIQEDTLTDYNTISEFAHKMLSNQAVIDDDIQEVINNDFWEML